MKSFLNENKCMYGWNPQKPIKVDGNDTTTLSHQPYILCHFADLHKYALCLLVVYRGGLWKPTFCDLFLLLFVSFRNGYKRGGRGGQGLDA